MKIELSNCEGQSRLFFRDLYEADSVADYLEHVTSNQVKFHPANVYVKYDGVSHRYMDHYSYGPDMKDVLRDLHAMDAEIIRFPSDRVSLNVDMYEHKVVIKID